MKEKGAPFLIAVSFLLSLITIRLLVLFAGSAHSEFAAAAKAGVLPSTKFYIGRNIILFGYHIHHFFFGIFFIIVAGWIAIVGKPNIKKEYLAILYGTGLGLFLDEIGFLITWGDYFTSLTYIITLILIGFLFSIIFFPAFLRSIKKDPLILKSGLLGSSFLSRQNPFFELMDTLSSRIFKPEKMSNAMLIVLYFSLSLMILMFPSLLKYFIGGGFVVEGMLILARPFYEGDKNED